jgi:hypothetical protein
MYQQNILLQTLNLLFYIFWQFINRKPILIIHNIYKYISVNKFTLKIWRPGRL